MKNKKLFLPVIIIVVTILAIAAYSVISNIAQKPAVTEKEFPFSITYELNGEKVTISDVYKVRFDRNDGYADSKTRVYVGEIGNMGEGNTVYTLKKDENTRVELSTNFYPDYLMGDAEYDYFDDEAFEPQIYYYDAEEQEYSDEETLSAQGVKLISFEYPTPIENSFVFSHISYFSGAIVLPTLIIALLSLVAIIIFVRKEKELTYKTIDIVSIIFNVIICVTLVPFVSLAAMLIDINGGGPELYRQVLYFLPSFSVLCIATSVALRRKGCKVTSLISGLIGPAFFVVYLIVCGVCELL
jgi:hypothetical protein